MRKMKSVNVTQTPVSSEWVTVFRHGKEIFRAGLGVPFSTSWPVGCCEREFDKNEVRALGILIILGATGATAFAIR